MNRKRHWRSVTGAKHADPLLTQRDGMPPNAAMRLDERLELLRPIVYIARCGGGAGPCRFSQTLGLEVP
jgi:hypothetical protein